MKLRDLKTVKPRRKWRRRALWGLGALVLAGLATPFVFTSSLLRYYISHSAYRDLPVRFRKATLSPTGRLTLYDLEINDRDGSGRHLLFAEQAVVTFNWLHVTSSRVQTVQLENLELWLHPGKKTPLSLLGLLDASASATGPAVPDAGARGADRGGFWCDDVIVSGHVRIADYDPWMPLVRVRNDDPIPVRLAAHFAGTPADPRMKMSLLLGDSDIPGRPFLTGIVKTQNLAGDTVFEFERLHLGNIAPQFSESLLRDMPNLPSALRHPVDGRFDRLILSGTLAVGREVTINASAELRDFSAQSTVGAGSASPGGAATVTAPREESERAFAVEHLNAATHVEGKLTAAPFRDLKFTRSHCAWDTLQLADWRVLKGVADVQLEGGELSLLDLQADCADVHVKATAALNLSTGILTRGRLSTSRISIQHLRERLPAAASKWIPEALEGNVEARVSLNESARDFIVTHVEIVGPEGLTFNVPGPTTAPAVRPGGKWRGEDWPGAALSNGVLSGDVLWHFGADWRPEVSHGRLTADQLLLISPAARGREGGTALNRIKSDFDLTRDKFRLDDFYADLPGNGLLALEGNVLLADGSCEDLVLRLNAVDLALVNPWLPAGWTLTGEADSEWHADLAPRAASLDSLDASLALGSQVVLTRPDARLLVAGTPVLSLHLTTDRRTGNVEIPSAEIKGVGAAVVDAGFVQVVRSAAEKAEQKSLVELCNQIESGVNIAFNQISFDGLIGPTKAAGNLSWGGMNIASESETGQPSLQNMKFRAEVAADLGPGYVPRAETVRVSKGMFEAERLVLGPNEFTGLTGNVAAQGQEVRVTEGVVMVAGGRVDAEATVKFDGSLERMKLDFLGLQQQVLFQNFKPDVFTAEGPISGRLLLETGRDGRLAGNMEVTADGPGRLKLTRQTSAASFAPVARAAMQTPDMVLPADFEEIVQAQLSDYPYLTGKALLKEDESGLHLKLSYDRAPLQEGDPGYGVPVTVAGQKVKANLGFELSGGTVTLHRTAVELVRQFLGY